MIIMIYVISKTYNILIIIWMDTCFHVTLERLNRRMAKKIFMLEFSIVVEHSVEGHKGLHIFIFGADLVKDDSRF